MSEAQHTSLLDDYLQKTASCRVANLCSDRHQLETLVLDGGDDALPHPSEGPVITGNMMLKDVHQALDEVLAAATGSPAIAVGGRQTPTASTQQSRVRARAATQQQQGQQQAGLTSSLGPDYASGSTPGKQHGSGIFRAMRQADAAALYAQRFKRDQEDRGQQQQPVLVAPDDGTNGAVHVIASNAALQAKLAKLQADMDARSYRQHLLQQLQQPGALFHPQQQQQQHTRQHQRHGHSHSIDTYAADASGQPTDTAVFQGLLGQFGSLRPATSPALMGGTGMATDPTAAVSNTATAASSRRTSMADSNRDVQLRSATGTASLPGTPGKLAAAQQQQQQRLQHLKELAEYELLWKPAVPAASRVASNSGKAGDVYSSHVLASQQARPWTSAGAAAAEPSRRRTSIGGSSSSNRSHKLQGLAATPRRHSTLGGSTATSHQQPQQQQSQQQHVQRPASAVAALQQSLSELAVFKTKVQQHQQEQPASIEQPTILQQHHHQHTWRQTDPGLGCSAAGSGMARQRPHSSSWLPDHDLQHLHEAAGTHSGHDNSYTGAAAAAMAAAAAGEYLLQRGRAASTGGGYFDGHLSRHRAEYISRRRSSTAAGYGLWDSWQEHVHNQAATAAADVANGYRSSSYGGSLGHSGLQRAQCVPRPLRAWDVLPLPSATAAAASGRARRRSCSVSSPGKLTGHLQQLRQQQHWQQQEQRRPMTAGGALGGMADTARASSSVRPLGLHNSHVAFGAASGTAAAVTMGSTIRDLKASSSSAWLVSSPLKRAQQLVATGSRPRSSSGGGSAAAAAAGLAGAAGRARSVAAVLSGVQAPGAAAQQARNCNLGGSNADSRWQSRLGARASTPGNAAAASAAPHGAGNAASVTAQLLQQVRAQQASGGGARGSCSGAMCADRVTAAAAAARGRSSGGGSSSAAGSAPLTAQILEYAAGLYNPRQARRKQSDSCSTSSSDTSDSSSNLAPATRDKQSAYAAALARVRAAKQASRRDDTDDDSS